MSLIEIGQNFGANSEFLFMLIITISIVWLILIIYSLRKDGIKKTTRYFLPMMVAALFIEATGVASGRFHYPGYLIYFSILGGSVPLIILLGWSSNLYLFLNMSKPVVSNLYPKKNIIQLFLISIVSGFFGICLDILEDPLASNNGWWVWNESSVGLSYAGVPFSNFMDWFIIIFFMSLLTLLIGRSGYSENRKLLISFFSLPAVFAAIYGTHLFFTGIFQFAGLI